jgi:hypothetical protein
MKVLVNYERDHEILGAFRDKAPVREYIVYQQAGCSR